MSFADIRDQEVAVRLLRCLIRKKRTPSGLLFWGPGGVGKRMAAIEMAKAVNCTSGAETPCDTCLSCRKVASGNHPDVRVLVPSRTSRVIHLESIREICGMAALRPFESQWRVFVVVDAERMWPDAQHHFLKTLEEPPGRSLFILLTEYPRRVFPTIRSRCQLVRFRTLRPETVVELLRRERDLPEDLAISIANLAQGQMSRALDLVDSERRDIALALARRLAEGGDPVALAEEFQKTLDEQRKQIEATVKADLGGDTPDASREDLERMKEERMAHLNAQVRREMLEYLYLLETWYRDELVFSETRETGRLLNRDQAERFSGAGKAAGRAALSDPRAKILAIEGARRYLDRFVNEERVFRDLFFSLATP